MNPYRAYEQSGTTRTTRVDMILALYDGAIASVENGRSALLANDAARAYSLLMKAQQFIEGLAAGLDLSQVEATINLLRLFEFCAHCVGSGSPEKLEAAVKVLKTLREGYQEIRTEAIRLERTGEIPPLESTCLVRATA
jgi:flagellar biosynthetic protein FliS